MKISIDCAVRKLVPNFHPYPPSAFCTQIRFPSNSVPAHSAAARGTALAPSPLVDDVTSWKRATPVWYGTCTSEIVPLNSTSCDVPPAGVKNTGPSTSPSKPRRDTPMLQLEPALNVRVTVVTNVSLGSAHCARACAIPTTDTATMTRRPTSLLIVDTPFPGYVAPFICRTQ